MISFLACFFLFLFFHPFPFLRLQDQAFLSFFFSFLFSRSRVPQHLSIAQHPVQGEVLSPEVIVQEQLHRYKTTVKQSVLKLGPH